MSESYVPNGTVQYQPIVVERRPATVEAWYWTGAPGEAERIVDWINGVNGNYSAEQDGDIILIKDPAYVNAIEPVTPKMWVIRDQFNDFWPLEDAVFKATYRKLHG